jgi:hypothetical protein
MIFKLAALILALIFSAARASERPEDAAFRAQLSSFCENRARETKICPNDKAGKPSESPAQVMAALCAARYRERGCATVAATIADKSELISCSAESLCNGQLGAQTASCVLDGVRGMLTIKSLSSTALGAAMAGGLGAAGGILAAMPFLAYDASESSRQCDQDAAFKRAAIKIHNLSLHQGERPLALDEKDGDGLGQDRGLLKVPCFELIRFLQSRDDAFSYKRLEASRWQLDPDRSPTPASEILKGLVNANECLRDDAIVKRFCRTLTSLGIGAALGAGLNASARVGARSLESSIAAPASAPASAPPQPRPQPEPQSQSQFQPPRLPQPLAPPPPSKAALHSDGKAAAAPNNPIAAAAARYRNAVPSEDPPKIPYFAMGFDLELERFVPEMNAKLRHDVVSFNVLSKPMRDPDALERYWSEIVDNRMSDFPAQIRAMAAQFPQSRSMLFDLAGFDPKRYEAYLKSGQTGSDFQNHTNLELKTILSDEDLFNHVRWFKGNRELSFKELYDLFGKIHPELFR